MDPASDRTPGLRRPPDLPPDEPLPDDDPVLLSRVHHEIRTAGPMTFARFMELVLYDPERGYYSGAAPRAGRSGDFLTAAESHPLFGWALARQVVEIAERLGRPDPFVIREHGAGSGALALAILAGLRREDPRLAATVRYQPVETTAARVAALAELLRAAGLEAHLEPADGTVVGVVLANELLDALPTHRVLGGEDGDLRELYVGRGPDGDLVDVPGTPSSPGLAGRLASEGVALAPRQRAEVCLALDDWVADAAASLARGALLLIDYGHPATDLYDPVQRQDGTLRAYVRHRVHSDPYRHIGRQDLTAHVDLTALETATRRAGLRPLGATTQAEFLAGLGAGALLAGIHADPAGSLEASLEARAALQRMLDPAVTGRFRVVAYGRGIVPEPPLRGFAFRLRPVGPEAERRG